MKLYTALAALGLVALIGFGPARATELTNGRITVDFAVPSNGIATTDSDRIDSISWMNSLGRKTGNLTSNFPEVFCDDRQWYFGDSYGEDNTGEPRELYAVYGGEVSSWTPIESGLSGVSASNGATSCGQQWSATVKTEYQLAKKTQVANAMKITRKFTFLPYARTLPLVNLRSFVPRLKLPRYVDVLVPSTDGTIHTYNVDSCVSACDLPNWTGTWFADDDGHGNGMVMIRDQSSTWPAVIAMDNDDGANGTGGANATSIALVYPASGWTGTITETQWLCFYDRYSWSAASRAAGVLPEGCQVPMADGRRR